MALLGILMSYRTLDAIYRNRRIVVVIAIVLGALVAAWIVG